MKHKELAEAVTSEEQFIKQHQNNTFFRYAIEFLDADEPSLKNCIHMLYNMSNIIKQQQDQITGLMNHAPTNY